MGYVLNISACHRCPLKQFDATVLRCTVSDGAACEPLARSASCPKGLHSDAPDPVPPPNPSIPLAGDVLAEIIKRIGADRLARLWERWTGKPCGCQERKARLNAATERLMKWLGRARNISLFSGLL